MIPLGGIPTASVSWNGGRNGWASFMVGFGWMPGLGALATPAERRRGIRAGKWGLHVYLGLWVLTLRGRESSNREEDPRG